MTHLLVITMWLRWVSAVIFFNFHYSNVLIFFQTENLVVIVDVQSLFLKFFEYMDHFLFFVNFDKFCRCSASILPQYKAINRLTPPTLCIQTPPRRSSADPKPICHFDPLLGGFLYLAWFFDSCIPLRDMVPNVPSGYWKFKRKKSKVYAI